jgi:hypothetical protein
MEKGSKEGQDLDGRPCIGVALLPRTNIYYGLGKEERQWHCCLRHFRKTDSGAEVLEALRRCAN